MLVQIIALVVGMPLLLLALLLVLATLEERLLAPDERAAELSDLVRSERAPEEVETAAAAMLAAVVQSERSEESREDAGHATARQIRAA